MVATKNIGLTLRVVEVPGRNERRDVIDQAWIAFLEFCGFCPVLIPNTIANPAAYIRALDIQGVVFTGGNNISTAINSINGDPLRIPVAMDDLASERDLTESKLVTACIEADIPLLGICRGMQFLNVLFGGSLTAIHAHAGTQHALTQASTAIAADYHFDKEVNSYHNYAVLEHDQAQGFHALAKSNQVIEAMTHEQHKILAMMWHPERNTPFSDNDQRVVQNFFSDI